MSLPFLTAVRRLIPRFLVPDVAIHGRHSSDWNRAFAPDAPVWARLAGVARPAEGEARWWRKRVVVPLMEPHIATMPFGCHALVPAPEAMAVLADKAKFADYAERIGAAHLLPRRLPIEDASFPAVLKRTTLNAGNGIVLVRSPAELAAQLAAPPWAGRPVLLQEAIPARTDYVTYVVAVRGRIVWHCTYAYPLQRRLAIRGPVGKDRIRRRTRPADLAAIARLLQPLAYDGPANIDYRRRPDGSIAILEINPRLGGSLMKPENVRDLAACLRSIVRHARRRPEPAPQSSAVPDEART